jgi:ABC-2 type transport system permease protein
LRQHVRGRRLLILAGLFLLPAAVTILARSVSPPSERGPLLSNLIFTLIPHALLPLTALLYAAGMIRDEIEDQTLTYLLVRPLPRWAIYLTKLLATWLVTALLSGVFTTLTYAAIYWDAADFWTDILPARALPTALLLGLSLAAYCSIFGLLSLVMRWVLVVGVAYIILIEWSLANVDFAVRRLTVVYYFRVLSVRWLDLQMAAWALDLSRAPSATSCVLTLLGVSLAAAALASVVFAGREFRVKTPEGS